MIGLSAQASEDSSRTVKQKGNKAMTCKNVESADINSYVQLEERIEEHRTVIK